MDDQAKHDQAIETEAEALARANACMTEIQASLLKFDCHLKQAVEFDSDGGKRFTLITSTN